MPDIFKSNSSGTGGNNQLLPDSNTQPQIDPSDIEGFDKVLKAGLGNLYNAAKIGVDIKNDLKKEFDQIKSDYRSKFQKSKNELDNLEKKFTDNLNNIQSRNLESLALFATLFTFLSISVQLYSRLENLYQALIFTCILGLIIFIIISSFFIFTRDILRNNWSVIAFFTVLGIFIIFIGIIVTVEFGKGAILMPNCSNKSISMNAENCFLKKQQLEEILKN